MKTTGERIKDIRLENGMSKTEFGKLFETTGSLVNKWETNQVTPTEKRLKAIAELGNTTVNQLLNSNPLSDYSTDELLQELERRGISHETTYK